MLLGRVMLARAEFVKCPHQDSSILWPCVARPQVCWSTKQRDNFLRTTTYLLLRYTLLLGCSLLCC